ncbi:MAG: thioether cross-link-forming SCIFF peptide maturase [Firmicutes bacterium]|nr:thioether cross-link-forming SCIFF peptide maturase [Bacillota bacterium]
MQRNWHRFGDPGARLLLDVQTGSLHAIDEAAWAVLEALEQADGGPLSLDSVGAVRPLPAETAGGHHSLDLQWVQEVLDDLDLLMEQGVLTYPDEPDTDVGELGPGVLKAMCLHLAHDCDMRCGYCFAGTGGFGGARALMPAKVGMAALDLLVEASGHVRHLEVDFFGGEPLMNMEALCRIVQHGQELAESTGKVLKFTVTTNALGLTDEIGQFLNDNGIAAVLSLDGRARVHDAVRRGVDGKGTFAAAAANALKFVNSRKGGEYYIRGTYTRRNLDFVDDVLFLADMGFETISFEPVVAEASSPYSIREEDLPDVFASYDRLVGAMAQRHAAGQGFRFFHFDLDIAHGPCLAKRLMGCGAGREYAAVTPDGKLYPCHQFVGRPGFEMGDVHRGIIRPEVGEQFGAAHIYAKPACRECWARFMCSGGCHANAHQMAGSLHQPYAIGCAITKKRLESALALKALTS